MGERLIAARQGVQNMAMYLVTALKESGCTDPQQEVVDTILAIFDASTVSKIQLKAPNSAINPLFIIENILVLIELMQKNKQLNASDLILIKQNLTALKGCIIKE